MADPCRRSGLSRGLSIASAPFYRVVKRQVHFALADVPHGAHRGGYTSSSVPYPQHQTTPEDPATAVAQVPHDVREADLLRAAFRDLHGPSLHGFTLLLTLGDRQRAESVATAALAEGASRAGSLRHPERAAAWLRAKAIRTLKRPRLSRSRSTREQRRAALHALGTTDLAIAGLSVLSLQERAALVASGIERLDGLDLESVLGRSRSGVRRVIFDARRRYLAAIENSSAEQALIPAGGLLARRIAAIAAQALGTGPESTREL